MMLKKRDHLRLKVRGVRESKFLPTLAYYSTGLALEMNVRVR